MGIFLQLLALWFVLSIPLSLLVGQLLASQTPFYALAGEPNKKINKS